MDIARSLALICANKCEDFELVATAGSDELFLEKQERIKYPSKGFKLFEDIVKTRDRIGAGGIFTAQCLEKLRKELGDKIHDYERIIIFSDSQDIDVCYGHNVKPRPFGKYNYICDVSCHTRGVAYKGVWTAEISGWSEHMLDFIEAIENTFND